MEGVKKKLLFMDMSLKGGGTTPFHKLSFKFSVVKDAEYSKYTFSYGIMYQVYGRGGGESRMKLTFGHQ